MATSTQKSFTGQIVGLKKLHNSYMGNPKYLVRIYKFDETIELRTATDAGFAYAIDSHYMNKYATFTVRGTKRRVITDIILDK